MQPCLCIQLQVHILQAYMSFFLFPENGFFFLFKLFQQFLHRPVHSIGSLSKPSDCQRMSADIVVQQNI